MYKKNYQNNFFKSHKNIFFKKISHHNGNVEPLMGRGCQIIFSNRKYVEYFVMGNDTLTTHIFYTTTLQLSILLF